jgi:hypothetical protein
MHAVAQRLADGRTVEQLTELKQELAQRVGAHWELVEGRGRVDQGAISSIIALYRAAMPLTRNEVAKLILEDQLMQTDLTPEKKAQLRRVLAVLTDYGHVLLAEK